MSNTVSATRHNHKANSGSLYTPQGARKYLTRAERQRVLPPLTGPLTDTDLMVLTLAWTGARISEVLALTPQAFQVEASVVALNTLKRRRPVVREVPIPRELMAALDRRYGLTATRQDRAAFQDRLWPCCRATAWRHMKIAMAEAGVAGHPACATASRSAACNPACRCPSCSAGWATPASRRPRSTPNSAVPRNAASPMGSSGGVESVRHDGDEAQRRDDECVARRGADEGNSTLVWPTENDCDDRFARPAEAQSQLGWNPSER